MSKQFFFNTVFTLFISGYPASVLAQAQSLSPAAQPSQAPTPTAQPSPAVQPDQSTTPTGSSVQPTQGQLPTLSQPSQSVNPSTQPNPAVQPNHGAALLKPPAQQTYPSIQQSPGTAPSTSIQPSQTTTPSAQPTQSATPSGPSVQPTQGQLPTPSQPNQVTTPTAQPSPAAQPTQSATPSSPLIQPTQVQPLVLPAQPIPETIPENPYIQQVRQSAIIPSSSAIAVTFCAGFEVNSKHKSGFPATLFLARPLLDSNGNMIAPVNSLVTAQLKPTGEGVEITAEALVIGGLVVPIKTSTLSIPMISSVRQESNAYYSSGQNNQGLVLGLANGVQRWLGSQGILSDGVSDVLDLGLSVVGGASTGLNNRKPKVTTTMKITEKVLYILTMTSPVAISPVTTQIALAAGGEAAGPVCSESTGGYTSGSSYRPYVPPAPNAPLSNEGF